MQITDLYTFGKPTLRSLEFIGTRGASAL